MPRRGIPKFPSIKAEAEFWDTHSPLDFPSEFEEIEEVQLVRPPKEVMTLRMDKATIELIKRVARKLGVQHTTLARTWLVERATAEAKASKGTRKAKRSQTAA